MTQKDIELVWKDICARLLYGLIINVCDTFPCTTLPSFNIHLTPFVSTPSFVEPILKIKDRLTKRILKEHTGYLEFRPFLRPLSSMTEEEKEEYQAFFNYDGVEYPEEYIDWLNKHHFDYRGLIEKGLALEAPEGMYNLNKK